jgi:hypothetical protein
LPFYFVIMFHHPVFPKQIDFNYKKPKTNKKTIFFSFCWTLPSYPPNLLYIEFLYICSMKSAITEIPLCYSRITYYIDVLYNLLEECNLCSDPFNVNVKTTTRFLFRIHTQKPEFGVFEFFEFSMRLDSACIYFLLHYCTNYVYSCQYPCLSIHSDVCLLKRED